MRVITSTDIAKLAGVSQTTVSRVLRGKVREFNISEETAEKVRKVAEAHHYKLNRNARSLASQKSYNIGFAVRELDYLNLQSFSKVISGIIKEGAVRDYNFSVCVLSQDNNLQNLHYLKKIQERTVDGLIIKDTFITDEEIENLKKIGIPFVLMDHDMPYGDFYFINSDYLRAAYLLVEHLAKLGHKDICLCSESSHDGTSEFLRGYQYGISKFGIQNTFEIDFIRGLFTVEGHHVEEIEQALVNRSTAIICQHDHSAATIMKYLQNKGLRVPKDISVVGCGNATEATLSNPALTSIELFQTTAGEQATKLLFDIMDKKKILYRKSLIPVELVVRNSTAPPPKNKK